MDLKISEIVIYPVKSLAGIFLTEARICDTGFVHDREWMIVDDRGFFLTQRQHPSLALVRATPREASLQLEAPGFASVDVPVVDGERTVEVTVWSQRCEAVDQGEPAARLLSNYLKRPCRLVRMSSRFRRQINPKYRSADHITLAFPDSMPFLLTSQASLDDLNSRLEEPVEMDRFRPNIVVAGGIPYQEDGWNRIRIGDIAFRVAKSCVRCEMPNVNQSTAVKGIEPIETLGTYRVGPKGVLFGRHLIHEDHGVIHIGDSVEVLES